MWGRKKGNEKPALRVSAVEFLNVDEDIRQAFINQRWTGYPETLPTLMQISRNMKWIIMALEKVFVKIPNAKSETDDCSSS